MASCCFFPFSHTNLSSGLPYTIEHGIYPVVTDKENGVLVANTVQEGHDNMIIGKGTDAIYIQTISQEGRDLRVILLGKVEARSL